MVVKTKMADISPFQEEELDEIIAINMARRQFEGRHLLFGEFVELNNRTCTIEDELHIDGGTHVLAMFLN